jgi:hypothetical protein
MKHGIAASIALLLLAAAAPVLAQPQPTPTHTSDSLEDQRSSFEASGYLGEVVDTFAGDETINYLNPQDANKSTLRAIAGVDFGYRLFGDSKSDRQTWIYGETIHGVRSKDVDCSNANNVKLSVCSQHISEIQMGNPGDQFIAILRGASSLEAYLGVRIENPWPLQGTTDTPARWYITAQAGFLSVAGGGGDVVDMDHIGIGAMAVKGDFAGSYLEIGVGRNDLFLNHRNKRALVDGFLTANAAAVPGLSALIKSDNIRPFIEFTGDFDLGKGSDSIQTWFGLDFHLGRAKTSTTTSQP